jgi:hypothetical protein
VQLSRCHASAAEALKLEDPSFSEYPSGTLETAKDVVLSLDGSAREPSGSGAMSSTYTSSTGELTRAMRYSPACASKGKSRNGAASASVR